MYLRKEVYFPGGHPSGDDLELWMADTDPKNSGAIALNVVLKDVKVMETMDNYIHAIGTLSLKNTINNQDIPGLRTEVFLDVPSYSGHGVIRYPEDADTADLTIIAKIDQIARIEDDCC